MWINPMGLGDPWSDSIDIIALKPAKKIGINPMGISYPWADSLVIISFQTVKKH